MIQEHELKINTPVKLEHLVSQTKRNPIIRSKILREAYRIAQKSKSEFRHGAVIYNKNKIIATGYNIPKKSHPKGSGRNSTTHAEVMAITLALKTTKDFSKLEILIIRLNKKNQFLLSKPCNDCMNLIQRLGMNPIWSI